MRGSSYRKTFGINTEVINVSLKIINDAQGNSGKLRNLVTSKPGFSIDAPMTISSELGTTFPRRNWQHDVEEGSALK